MVLTYYQVFEAVEDGTLFARLINATVPDTIDMAHIRPPSAQYATPQAMSVLLDHAVVESMHLLI